MILKKIYLQVFKFILGVYLCVYTHIPHPISIKKRTALFLSHVRPMELCPSASCLNGDLTLRGIEDGVESGADNEKHRHTHMHIDIYSP